MTISITPITAYQDTEQVTMSGTAVSANCTTAALADGIEYFVFYCGNFGGSTSSNTGALQFNLGSTIIGYAQGEGLSFNFHTSIKQCMGGRKVTGNGTDTLSFSFFANSGTVFAGAMAIIAIPLTDLVENTDYWHSGTNSPDFELSDAVSSWEPLRQITTTAFDVPVTGDYLVFPSCEGRPTSASGNGGDRTRVRFSIDGSFITAGDDSVPQFVAEWEDNIDINSITSASIQNLTAGEHTLLIEVASLVGQTRSDYRRSNLFVLNMSRFEQHVQTQDTTGASTTSTTFSDFSGLDQTYTPIQNEHVLHIAYLVGAHSTVNTAEIEIRNKTDSTSHCISAGEYNNDNGFDLNKDIIPFLALYSEQYSTAKSWSTRFKEGGNTGGTALVGRNRDDSGGIESNFISLGLTILEDLTLTADSGTYTYSGTAATLTHDIPLALDSGTYTYSGTAVDFKVDRILTADSGTYTYSGTALALKFGRILALDSGTYTYTGTSVELDLGFTLSADSGTYTYSGTALTFTRTLIFPLASGGYTYSGTDVILNASADVWDEQADEVTTWSAQSTASTVWTPQTDETTTWI